MRKYFMLLSVLYLLLPGCLEYQYSDSLWAPKEVPTMQGDRPEMRDITYWCNDGYYKGFSPKNLDSRMSTLCEPLDDDTKICAVKAVDEHRYTITERVYDEKRQKWSERIVDRVEYETYMLNIYINAKNLVYDCKGERGDFSIFTTKKPAAGTLSSRLPQ